MGINENLTAEIEKILTTSWDVRDGNVVPEPEDVNLKNGAVKITATFLYADLAGSSVLANLCHWTTTAKIIRAYLNTCTRLIRYHRGEIRSFDGDRVMGIFKSKTPNTDAVKCARNIDWVVTNIINPKAEAKFDSIKKNGIKIRHCIGIDTSEVVAVRAGIGGNNDLIWIGRAPSLAAKLSDLRSYPHEVYISATCYNSLADSQKIVDAENIWEQKTITFANENKIVYRTSKALKP